MEELSKLPVSEDIQRAKKMLLEQYRKQHETEEDPTERRKLASEIVRLEMPDMRSRADEIADKHGIRHRDTWILQNNVVAEDGSELSPEERDEVLSFPAVYQVARTACFQAVQRAVTLPNWNGHMP